MAGKRSFNSISSNQSINGKNSATNSSSNTTTSNNNNNNKKKKTQQKTLGVPWGSNSRSSSRSSFQSSPFSDFGSYIEVKNRKLQNQFDAEVSECRADAEKPIFDGVAIFVDGFTVPSNQELRGYMVKHGGHFENYFSRHRVTHIICSNLPNSKIKNLRSFSGGLPVVKPTWILDSVSANKLLSWVPYLIDQLVNESRNQPKLSAFFTPKICPDFVDAESGGIQLVMPEIKDSMSRGDTSNKFSSYEVNDLVKPLNQCSRESDNSSFVNARELKMAGSSEADTKIQSTLENEKSPIQPSTSAYCLKDKEIKESTNSTLTGRSDPSHSTSEDPNFVENYFKSSRLHFIGAWRNRYRKRFMGLSNGLKSSSSDSNDPSNARSNAIIHVDMDCFFVSVVIRNHPELTKIPVAVCHSDNPRGTAEISSSNYPARNYGVRAGMFVRDAKALCPHLVIIPYNFGAYEEVADQFYSILHQHCSKVQAVSCDEAFLEVAESDSKDPEHLASLIRKEIFETTGCTASAGIAGNMLMARLATRAAKPNGQYYIFSEKVEDYLCELPIKELPGIGKVLEEKLKMQQVRTCGELRMISKETLQKDFGIKTGNMLWSYSRGVDNRLVGVIQESKSIGAEVNWGVRFKDLKDSHFFLMNLCKEVSLRLQGCGIRGRTFTLKIKKRRKDAKEPAKYMGCGDCENLSHNMTVPIATDDLEVLQRISKQLFGAFHLDVQEIRGVGLQVSRLENADTAKQENGRYSLKSWLISAPASPKQCNIESPIKKSAGVDGQKNKINGNPSQLCGEFVQPPYQVGNNSAGGEAGLNQVSELPPLCDLDMGVIASLPSELFSEINQIYEGKLSDFITKHKGFAEDVNNFMYNTSLERVKDVKDGVEHVLSRPAPLDKIQVENKAVPVSREGSRSMVLHTSCLNKNDLMPSSLSQLDPLVLQQLPEEFRGDILGVLPAHRMAGHASYAALSSHSEYPQEDLDVKDIGNSYERVEFVSKNNIWSDIPPQWVDKFKMSDCSILKALTDVYARSDASVQFSSVLQRTFSQFSQSSNPICNGCDEAVEGLSELLRQYIKLKIESDIEEIFVCFCLLRRLRMKSEVVLKVYNAVCPYIQESVGESYGGNFQV